MLIPRRERKKIEAAFCYRVMDNTLDMLLYNQVSICFYLVYQVTSVSTK